MTLWLRLLSVVLIAFLAMGPGYAQTTPPDCPMAHMAHHQTKAIESLCKAQCQLVVALIEPALTRPVPALVRPEPQQDLALVTAWTTSPPAPPPRA